MAQAGIAITSRSMPSDRQMLSASTPRLRCLDADTNCTTRPQATTPAIKPATQNRNEVILNWRWHLVQSGISIQYVVTNSTRSSSLNRFRVCDEMRHDFLVSCSRQRAQHSGNRDGVMVGLDGSGL